LTKEVKAIRKQPVQNGDVLEQLITLKALLKTKQKAQVQHQLEAALHSRATSLVSTQSFRKLFKAGYVEKFGEPESSLARPKWVELNFHSAEATECRVNKGKLMLSWADTKVSHSLKRCRVVRMGESDSQMMMHKSFSVILLMSGSVKEIVFGCKDEETMQSWVQAFSDGFKNVKMDLNRHKTVNDYSIIEVEVRKKKLGIRVKEKLQGVVLSKMKSLNWEDIDSKTQELSMTTPGGSPRGWNPCDLEVTAVNDQALFASGLTENSILSAINGQNLRGMAYYKQLEHLNSTERPYTLTFLKKIDGQKIAFPRIIQELLADGDNEVKSAAYDLVKGSKFARELDESKDKAAVIAEMLANRQRLMDVLENTASSIYFKRRLRIEDL